MYKDLKVSRSTEPKKLAGTIKYHLDNNTTCYVYALGQQAIWIAVKGLALLKPLFSVPYKCTIEYFNEVKEDQNISGIKFTVTRDLG